MSEESNPSRFRRSDALWAAALVGVLVLGTVLITNKVAEDNPPEILEPSAAYALPDAKPGQVFSLVQSFDTDNPNEDTLSGKVTFFGAIAYASTNVLYLGANVVLVKQDQTYDGRVERGFKAVPASAKDATFLPPAADLTVRRANAQLTIPQGFRAVIVAGFALASGDVGAVNRIEMDYSAAESVGRTVLTDAAIVCGSEYRCPESESGRGFVNGDDVVDLLDRLGLLDLDLINGNVGNTSSLPIVTR